VDEAISTRGLQFNLTHSRSLALLAVTTGQAVGIDVEDIVGFSNPDVGTLAEGLLSKREIGVLMALEREGRMRSFLRCWTRKEALLKAAGVGLLSKLDEFEVPMDDVERWSVQWRSDRRSPPLTFQMADLSDCDHSAAVAAPLILGPVHVFDLHRQKLNNVFGQ
jgi:4'-phosphopantetheinyl transferase